MLRSLQQFITLLRREREIADISAPVDPHLEAAEIHRRILAREGPALLFRSIKGAAFPLVTNLFGTRKRIELAFGPRPERLMRELAELPHTLMPPTPGRLWQKRGLFWEASKIGFRRRRSGSVLSHDGESRLDTLPLLTTWEQDAGPFITLPLVYTEHPASGISNLGMYRLQRFDASHTGFHCQIGKGGGFHLAEAEKAGRALPVNVFVGGPPALILSAIAPLPENVPELLLASLVQGGKLRLAHNPHGPLPLVAEAEFALVGEVKPHERRPEGPFGDHYGYYSLKHDYPVFTCKRMLHRKNAIFAATVVGKPRQEDFFLGDYLQQLLAPLFPVVMPAVSDLWSYGETGYHSLAAAVVKQRYKREAMVSAFRILGEGQLSLTKFLLVLDKAVDLRDFKTVLQHVLERCDFRSDAYVFSNLAMDTLDYTGPAVNEGSKGVLLGLGDPIRALEGKFSGELPRGIKKAAVFCKGCLVLEGERFADDPKLAEAIAPQLVFGRWPLIVLVDNAEAATRTTMDFLWTTFTRFEPAGDLFSAKREIVRNHISYSAPLVLDARMKPTYPDELECDPATAKLVDSRWHEYFNSSEQRSGN